MNRLINDGYVEWLKKNNKSNSTVKTYLSDLDQFFGGYNALSRNNILGYAENMRDKISVTSLNRKMSSLKSYNEYLISKGILSDMVVQKSDHVSVQKIGNPTKVNTEDVLKFLNTVKEKPSRLKIRNIAIIYLITNTGIRREEACNLKITKLKFDKDGGLLEVIGKGNKKREVALNDTAVRVLQNYLHIRSKSRYADSKYLFLSQRGGQLTKESINSIFDFYSDEVKINPHALRHNWCTTMLEENILTLPEIKDQAGHQSITTTQLYTHARQDSIRKRVKSFSIG